MKFVRLLNDHGKEYDSYTDFWRLVRLSGLPICEQNDIDRSRGETYIFPMHNGNSAAIAAVPRPPSCRMICWQLERPVKGLADNFAPLCYDEVWVSDRYLAQELKRFGAHHVKYVTMGGHPELGGQPCPTKAWDVTHQCYAWGKREATINALKMQGYRVGPACWGQDRDLQLASSKVGLCLHQDHLKILEPLRYTLFACWRLPIVAEECESYHPYQIYDLSEIDQAITNGDGESNYHLLAHRLTFKKCVEAAL